MEKEVNTATDSGQIAKKFDKNGKENKSLVIVIVIVESALFMQNEIFLFFQKIFLQVEHNSMYAGISGRYSIWKLMLNET